MASSDSEEIRVTVFVHRCHEKKLGVIEASVPSFCAIIGINDTNMVCEGCGGGAANCIGVAGRDQHSDHVPPARQPQSNNKANVVSPGKDTPPVQMAMEPQTTVVHNANDGVKGSTESCNTATEDEDLKGTQQPPSGGSMDVG
uniref:Uncharacterized protein n=1 Tax=Sphaerodactylus townsendi TaxID=933632 RepID=A0ACB8EUH0_9SAUR